MTFDEIKSGKKVFIDANIFIYHFTGVSDECSGFLNRCEQGDLYGVTSVNVLTESMHRLMMIEAVNKKLVVSPNIVKKLQKKPGKIKQLKEYFINTQKIMEMGIATKTISQENILQSQAHRLKYGLMVNDSLIVTVMEEMNISLLATNDKTFSRIKKFSLCSAKDLN